MRTRCERCDGDDVAICNCSLPCGWENCPVRVLEVPQESIKLEKGSIADTLFERIKHGDEKHQEWLRTELNNFFAKNPSPLDQFKEFHDKVEVSISGAPIIPFPWGDHQLIPSGERQYEDKCVRCGLFWWNLSVDENLRSNPPPCEPGERIKLDYPRTLASLREELRALRTELAGLRGIKRRAVQVVERVITGCSCSFAPCEHDDLRRQVVKELIEMKAETS